MTPSASPGVIVAGQNAIEGLTIRFGDTAAVHTYGGLAPGATGLYQFDIVVPEVADGDHLLRFNVRGTEFQQTLYLTVRR